MKILLTGATGYIGKRLLPILLEQGHQVICCVRDKNRFPKEGIYKNANISLFEIDFLKNSQSLDAIKDIDAAYYLIHSMSSDIKNFEQLEAISANNYQGCKRNSSKTTYISGRHYQRKNTFQTPRLKKKCSRNFK
jgi:nucleoside-diphosphate-sugar epimerase